MSRRRAVLVTGAGGELGTGLIERLCERSETSVLALDLRPLPPELAARCATTMVGDILDTRLIDRLQAEFEIDTIFHLAALLSTRSEFNPRIAHDVNVQGTLQLLELAVEQSRWHGHVVRFLFPSSIAVYGLPDLVTKRAAGRVPVSAFPSPTTMYGCNKLACEQLGRYYARHYRQLAVDDHDKGVDFRALRFPGLISAETLPSGGTSDYAPEMIHAAARREPYACFVREDTLIPFMAMPDAIDALLSLSQAPREALSHHVYNVGAFERTAGAFAGRGRAAFPEADISFRPDQRRQAIVDSWPEAVDDGPARTDWGFFPVFDFERTFEEYLIPGVTARYR